MLSTIRSIDPKAHRYLFLLMALVNLLLLSPNSIRYMPVSFAPNSYLPLLVGLCACVIGCLVFFISNLVERVNDLEADNFELKDQVDYFYQKSADRSSVSFIYKAVVAEDDKDPYFDILMDHSGRGIMQLKGETVEMLEIWGDLKDGDEIDFVVCKSS